MSFLEHIHNLKEDECIVDVIRNEVTDNECKTCGKCVYGYEGISQLDMILNDMVNKKAQSDDLTLLIDLGELMRDQSMCETGEEVGQAILDSIDSHRAELMDHINKRECKAGICKKFMTFHILVSRCTGCGKCIEACEEEAIIGKPKFVHVINQKDCLQCGKCIEACDKNAVVMAGKKKPKTPRKPIPVRVK